MSASIEGNDVNVFHWLSQRSALKLQIIGLSHSKGSVCKHLKDTHGFKGNKERVLAQFENWIFEQMQPSSMIVMHPVSKAYVLCNWGIEGYQEFEEQPDTKTVKAFNDANRAYDWFEGMFIEYSASKWRGNVPNIPTEDTGSEA